MAGIYIHIPFCKQACHYCNFYFSTSLGNKEKFLQALLQEIDLTKDYLEGDVIETIYLGGGTPSLLSISDLQWITDKLHARYNLDKLKEFTIEMNPDDIRQTESLKALGRLGINRLSVGIQSFFDEDLQYMNRSHNAQEAIAAIKKIQDAGFSNITLDLIYGTPTMSDSRWEQNIEQAFALQVPHISSYALTVEPKTALDKKINRGESKPIEESQTATQFDILVKKMEDAGFEHYEISNFAKPGKHAIHNTNYWLGKKYLGLGPSAHSFNKKSRRWNVANNINYINSIQNGALPVEEEILTETQRVNEVIMTSLRTQWGLDLQKIPQQLCDGILHRLKKIDHAHYVLENNVLKLTKQGKLFADSIASTLFVD